MCTAVKKKKKNKNVLTSAGIVPDILKFSYLYAGNKSFLGYSHSTL